MRRSEQVWFTDWVRRVAARIAKIWMANGWPTGPVEVAHPLTMVAVRVDAVGGGR